MNDNQKGPTLPNLTGLLLFSIRLGCVFVPCLAAQTTDWYYREGPLRGSLKSEDPLPLYDSNPEHLWNRLFSCSSSLSRLASSAFIPPYWFRQR